MKLSLKEVFRQVLAEDIDSEDIYELPNENMTVTADRGQKKIVFTPQFHKSLTNKVRTYVNNMKQDFMVLAVNDLKNNSFEVVFDPRQNFDEVIDYIKQISGGEYKV